MLKPKSLFRYPIEIRIEESLGTKIETFMRLYRVKNRSAALRQLIEDGLRVQDAANQLYGAVDNKLIYTEDLTSDEFLKAAIKVLSDKSPDQRRRIARLLQEEEERDSSKLNTKKVE
jgi:metal-responsive CopG/Arc/MetJ family transcriptional regulator